MSNPLWQMRFLMVSALCAVIAVAFFQPGGALTPAGAADADRIWVGPNPFVEGRTVRDDWFPVLSDPTQWDTVLGRANVFKSYLMVLPDVPVPGKKAPELSDEQLGALAKLCRDRRLKVAFEVGGLRQGGSQAVDDQWGERCAEGELRWLKRWLRVGGRIDTLTTDHALMMNLGAHYVTPETQKDCGMAMAPAIEELVDYFEACRQEIPGVRLGIIESLGYFHVRGPDGKGYPRTVPRLPVWWFHDVLDQVVAAMQKRGLALDHFHIDFGYEGVRHDGRREDRLDFGRIFGVEEYCRSKGVKPGVIINAFHDRSVKSPDAKMASREAYENTLRFTREYVAAGGKSEHLVVQTWQPYPDRTGPEEEPHTVLNIARDVLGVVR